MTRLMMAGFIAAVIPVTAQGGNGVTDFEFTDMSGLFSINAASFSGGVVQSIGLPELYHSGRSAWMIEPNEPGVITFDPPAANVVLFFRDQSSANMGTLTVEDADGNTVESFDADSFEWTEVNLVVGDGESPIRTITVVNNGGAGFTVVDDLAFQVAQDTDMDDMMNGGMDGDGMMMMDDDGQDMMADMDDRSTGDMMAAPAMCGAMSLTAMLIPLALLASARRRRS